MKEKIGVIGTGNVGTAMAVCLCRAGCAIGSAYNRSREKAKRLARLVPTRVAASAAEAAQQNDLLLLAVPDRAIVSLANELAASGVSLAEKYFYHLSGSQSAASLTALEKKGGHCGSLHPLQTFASVGEETFEKVKGAHFAIDGDEKATAKARELICLLGGKAFSVPPEKRALYHAAACVACNYLTALMDGATQLFGAAGLDKALALDALSPLVEATWKNIRRQGTAASLTGPIARGDAVTVRCHLEAMKTCAEEIAPLYKALGSYAARMSERRGSLTKEQAQQLIKLLET